MFLELGLPFIMRFINDWRAGKTTIEEAMHSNDEKPAGSVDEVEKRFLDKVERELGLPEYNIFSECLAAYHVRRG
jgi:anoctamin-10